MPSHSNRMIIIITAAGCIQFLFPLTVCLCAELHSQWDLGVGSKHPVFIETSVLYMFF